MKRYRVLHKPTGAGGETNAENGPQACRNLNLKYQECLWTKIKPTKGYVPNKHYVGIKSLNEMEIKP